MFECINFNILRDWTENQPFQHMKYEAEKDKYQKNNYSKRNLLLVAEMRYFNLITISASCLVC